MQNISNAKGQGLPINTIILIAVGLLILVLMIVFVTGGFKGLAPVTSSSSSLSSFQGLCNSYCSGSSYPDTWCTSNTVIGGVYYTCSNSTRTATGFQTCTITLENGSIGTWGYAAVGPTTGNHCALQSMS
ncbi:MAG: hypothetical protein ACP5MT_01335 [Candidatus Acidifodinimicrobium sp.]